MPPLEFTTIIFAIAAATLFATRRPAGRTSASTGFRHRLLPALMVAFGIFVSNILFLYSTRYMPAAEANLLVYTWPLMVVLLGALFGLVSLRRRHLISVALGLLGAALVIGPSVSSTSWIGIGVAVLSGFTWAVFCVYRLAQGAEAPECLTEGLALSAVVSAVLHLCLEVTVLPSPPALLSALLTGVIPLALGNLLWDRGLRQGNRILLSVAAYATPLAGALILIGFGFAQATAGLLAGGILIVLGGVLSARR
jgi:drug/metabolite transporter (DMT)-like permease